MADGRRAAAGVRLCAEDGRSNRRRPRGAPGWQASQPDLWCTQPVANTATTVPPMARRAVWHRRSCS